MSMTMHLDIVSLEQNIFSERVRAVFVTGALGEMGIYPGHAQLLSSLKPGQVRVQRENDQEELYYISGGILEVQPMVVTILADTVIHAGDIDEAAAIAAKERAERALKKKAAEFEYTRASAELAEAIAQIQTIQKLRKKYKV